jgi:hypothetical protein
MDDLARPVRPKGNPLPAVLAQINTAPGGAERPGIAAKQEASGAVVVADSRVDPASRTRPS